MAAIILKLLKSETALRKSEIWLLWEQTLKGFDVPDSVTEIGNNVFKDCAVLANVNISDNSNLETIGNECILFEENSHNMYNTYLKM